MSHPAGPPRLMRALAGEVLARSPIWLMRAEGAALDRRLERSGEGPSVFNLGRSILPDVLVEHVERLAARVTGHG